MQQKIAKASKICIKNNNSSYKDQIRLFQSNKRQIIMYLNCVEKGTLDSFEYAHHHDG